MSNPDSSDEAKEEFLREVIAGIREANTKKQDGEFEAVCLVATDALDKLKKYREALYNIAKSSHGYYDDNHPVTTARNAIAMSDDEAIAIMSGES